MASEMRDKDKEKIRFFFQHTGMFLREDNFSEAVFFIYAMSCWIDDDPMDGFFDWLIEKYLDPRSKEEFSSRGWGYLVELIPEFSTGDERMDTRVFLDDVEAFLKENKGL